MPFEPKKWEDAHNPNGLVDAAALIDLEERVTSEAALPDSVVTDSQVPNFPASRYGAKEDGETDDTAALQAALNAANEAGGGNVLVTGISLFSSTLDLSKMVNVGFVGRRGQGSEASNPKGSLVYTGEDAVAIELASSSAASFRDLRIVATNPAFTGTLLRCGHAVSGGDTSYLHINNCWIGGLKEEATKFTALDLKLAIICTIRNSYFRWCKRAIVRSAEYANVVEIDQCSFGQTTEHPIWNPGQSWMINNCTFEPLEGGKAGAVNQEGELLARGMVYQGNWHGDVTVEGNNWVEVYVVGMAVTGNYFGTAKGTGAGIVQRNLSQGVVSIGNRYETYNGIHTPEGANVYGPVSIDGFQGAGAAVSGAVGGRAFQFSPNSTTNGHFMPGVAHRGIVTGDQTQTANTGVLVGTTAQNPATSKGRYCLVGYLAAPVGGITAGSLWMTPRGDVATAEAVLAGGQSEAPEVRVATGKLGFYGTAPITKQNVKPAGEVTTEELCKALEALGLIE